MFSPEFAVENIGGGLDRIKAGSYSCCSCRNVEGLVEDCPVVEAVGGDNSGGEPRGLGDGWDLKDAGEEAGTVKESLRIFVNTDRASSRSAIA